MSEELVWKDNLAEALSEAKANGGIILAYWGNHNSCYFCRLLEQQVFSSDDFKQYATGNGNVTLLKNAKVPGASFGGIPACVILDSSGNILATRVGFGNGTHDSWMAWFEQYAGYVSHDDSSIDLVATSFFLSDSADATEGVEIVTGEQVYLTCTIKNNGSNASGIFTVHCKVDGKVVLSRQISLEAGETLTLAGLELGTFHSGAYDLELIVDPDNAIEEYNESNNRLKNILTVGFEDGYTLVAKNDSVIVNSGETVSKLLLLKDATMTISSGGSASDIVFNGGILLQQGGTLTNAEFTSGAYGSVMNSAVIKDIVVNSDSYLYLGFPFGCASASAVRVGVGGYMAIYSNAYANNVQVDSTGCFDIGYYYGSGQANDVTVSSGGVMRAFENSYISDIRIESGGSLTISSGTTLGGVNTFANEVKIFAPLNVLPDTVVYLDISKRRNADAAFISNITYLDGIDLRVKVADNQGDGKFKLAECATLVNQVFCCTTDGICLEDPLVVGEAMRIDGKAYLLQLQSGTLSLIIDGSAPTFNSEPYFNKDETSVTILWNAATDVSGIGGYDVRVDNAYYSGIQDVKLTLENFDRGSHTYSIRAYDTLGNYTEWSREKTFDFETVEDAPVLVYSGRALVSVGNVMQGIYRGSGSGLTFQVYSGGIASGNSMYGGGYHVYSGGLVKSNRGNWSYIYVNSSGIASGNSMPDGRLIVNSGGIAVGNSGFDWLWVSSGGTATSNRMMKTLVESGATATNISGAVLFTATGDDSETVINGTINGRDYSYSSGIWRDGFAGDVGYAYPSQWLSAHSSGVVIASGAIAYNTLLAGLLYVQDGGVASNLIGSGGVLYLSNGSAYDANIYQYGSLCVASGNDNYVNGICISSGMAIVQRNATLNLAGNVQIIGGCLSVEFGGDINASEAEFVFDLTDMAPDNDVFINGFNRIEGGTYRVQLGDNNKIGTYFLIGDVYGYEGSINVCNSENVCYELAVGEEIVTEKASYSLAISRDNKLFLSLGLGLDGDTVPPVLTSVSHTIYGNGNARICFAATDNVGVSGYEVRLSDGSEQHVTGEELMLSMAPNTSVSYQVRAVDLFGNYSEWSDLKEISHQTTAVSDDAAVIFTSVYNGIVTTAAVRGQTLSGYTIDKSSSHRGLHVSSGGIAIDITINNSTYASVASGGMLFDATMQGEDARIHVENGGYLSQAVVSGLLNELIIYEGGYAQAVSAANDGRIIVSSGGLLQDAHIYSSGIYGAGQLSVIGGSVSGLTIDAGGGYASSAIVENVIIGNGGGLFLDDSVVKGSVDMSGNCDITISGNVDTQNAVFNIDLSERTFGDTAILSGTGKLNGGTWRIIADDEQTGTFLISDIQNLNSNIQFAFSVDASNEYEIVSFNSPARYGDKLVSLVYDANLCTTTLTLGNATNDVNAPTGVSGLSASQQGMAVTFDWMPATDDIGIAGYQVEFDGDRYLTSGTSFLVLGYAPGSHSYRVRAYDTNLNYSEWSSGSISIVEPKDRKVVLYKSSVLQNADEAFVGVAMGEKENYDSMVISSGGKAISTILHRGAQQDVLAGGVASNTHMQAEWYTFEEEVELWEKPEQHQILQNVMSGGTAIGTVLAGPSKSHDELEEEEYWDLAGIVSGTQVILDGGVALSTTLKEGAQIISGGLAIMTEIDGGVQSVMCGSALSTVLLSGSAYVGNGGTALSANVRNGIIAVGNSGIAIGTVISSGATMLLTGGREENTTLMSGGSICVSAGVLNDFTLASGQVLTLGPNGGTASNLTLEEGGIFDLGYFGGAALYVTGNHKYGSFSVVSGVGSNLLAASGCRISTNGGSMIHPIVEKGGTISLTGSAYATDVELREGALFVFNAISGAYVTGTNERGAFLVSGNVVSNVIGGGYIASGGTGYDLVVSNGLSMDVLTYVSNVEIVNNKVMASSGAFVSNANIYKKGTLQLTSGATAKQVTVGSGGVMDLRFMGTGAGHGIGGGTAMDVEVLSGGTILASRGTLTRVSVQSGGRLVLGGFQDETTNLNNLTIGGTLEIGQQVVFDDVTLDVSERKTTDGYIITSIRKVAVYNASITVDSKQDYGAYALVKNDISLAGTLTVSSTSGRELGTLTVGGPGLDDGAGRAYSLVSYAEDGIYLQVSRGASFTLAPDEYDSISGNDSLDMATELSLTGSGFVGGLNIHNANDVDFYRFTLSGARVSTDHVAVEFDNDKGNLDVYLYDSQGIQVAKSISNADNERISLSGLSSGDYYVCVRGYDGAVNDYVLEYDVTGKTYSADDFEVNDTPEEATELGLEGSGSIQALTIHSGDDVDWYRFDMSTHGHFGDYIGLDFNNADGDLDFALFSLGSETPMAINVSTLGNGGRFSLAELKAGSYLLKVWGKEDVKNSYEIYYSVAKAVENAVDDCEENDDFEAAYVLDTINVPYGSLDELTIHQAGDVDYFKIILEQNGLAGDYVSIAFNNTLGDLDIFLYDSGKNLVQQAATLANIENISLNGMAAGEYFVKVVGNNNSTNSYSLNYHVTPVNVAADSFEGEEPVLIRQSTEMKGMSISPERNAATRQDTYRITLESNGNADTRVRFSNYRSDWDGLAWTLTDGVGKSIGSGMGTAVFLDGLNEGDYILTVDTPNEGQYGNYDIAFSLPEAAAKKSWSVLLYINGDNNLEQYYLSELVSMQRSLLDDGVEVYVLLDRSSNASYHVSTPNYGDWTDTRVGRLEYSPGNSLAMDWISWGELNTGDIATLGRFIDWGMEQSRADNYMLIVQDHGNSNGNISFDYTSNHASMSISAMAELLGQFDNISVVGFNACLMGSENVLNSMSGVTDYVVASEATGWTGMIDYEHFFESIQADSSARDVASLMVDALKAELYGAFGYDVTFGAFDTSGTVFAEALNSFGEASESFTSYDWARVAAGFRRAGDYGSCYSNLDFRYSDLLNVLNGIGEGSSQLNNAVKSLRETLQNDVIVNFKTNSPSYGQGLAVFNPLVSEARAYRYYAPGNQMESWKGFINTLATTYSSMAMAGITGLASMAGVDEIYATVSTYDLGVFSGLGLRLDDLYIEDDLYFVFDLTQNGLAGDKVIVQSPQSMDNLVLTLLNEDMEMVASGEGALSLEGISGNASGTRYYLKVQTLQPTSFSLYYGGNWASGVDRFDYIAGAKNQDGSNGNGSIGKATACSVGEYKGLMTYLGDSDWYKIGNEYNSSYNVTIVGTDILVKLYDASGNYLTAFDAEDTGLFRGEISGGQYLCVEGNNPLSSGVSIYSIAMEKMLGAGNNYQMDAPEPYVTSTSPTNRSVVVYALYPEAAGIREYSFDGENWRAYDNGVDVSSNCTVFFRASDGTGFVSEVVSYDVTNIDRVAPELRELVVGMPDANGAVTISLISSERLAKSYYSWKDGEWLEIANDQFSVEQNGQLHFLLVDLAGNETETATYSIDAFNVNLNAIECQTRENGCTIMDWSGDATAEWALLYDIALAGENGILSLYGLAVTGIELYNPPDDDILVSVKPKQSDVWTDVNGALENHPIHNEAPIVLSGEDNGMAELMFARGAATWSGSYQAVHVGVGDWTGTRQTVALQGKNVIADIYAGSDDASILLMTDDDNGDALFVDDIYSAFPEGFDIQARIARIDEIRAGAGDDVVDLTSQRFAYAGACLTVRGGLGNDVIWANKGENWLFGDAGNDRIVGAAGNDVLVGGSGDDVLHGGGGDDVFAFCGDWGNDTVQQLAGGGITLWFAENTGSWDTETLTYTDGGNSVQVLGECQNITLRFGGDESQQYQNMLAAGAFNEFTSEKIFEDKNSGMLA